jgi:ribosome recycling factor
MTVKEIIADCDLRMNKSIEKVRLDLVHLRAGKASIGLVEPIRVEMYGTEMPIAQMATVATPDARTITITPWDKTALSAISKAIQKSELSLNPMSDGQMIRLVIPPLNEENRRELVKRVKKEVEEGKVALRNVRRDAIEHVKRLEKDGKDKISEDDSHKAQEKIQELTDKHIKDMDHLFQLKEKEILEV